MEFGVVIQILTGIVSVVASFVIIKQKVAQHDEKFATMHTELKESFKKRDDDFKDGLKKLNDQITHDVTKVEKDLRTCFANSIMDSFISSIPITVSPPPFLCVEQLIYDCG